MTLIFDCSCCLRIKPASFDPFSFLSYVDKSLYNSFSIVGNFTHPYRRHDDDDDDDDDEHFYYLRTRFYKVIYIIDYIVMVKLTVTDIHITYSVHIWQT